MKAIGCKSVSKEIDELESGQLPGASTQAHLQACGACRSFYDDRQKLRQMLARLETVEAPGDFDFRLRARLANLRDERPAVFSSFGFGLPSVALAVLAILIGVGLYLRATTDSVTQDPLARSEVTKTAGPAAVQPSSPADVKSNELTASASRENPEKTSIEEPAAVVKEPVRSRKGNRSSNSNTIRRDDFLAKSETSAMFPLDAAEPLRVSVDYATGGSRTISLPAVSFGSQQVVARGASMVKTSARTVW
ncbi:MAG TPA: hypothetical protein VFV61_04405 [Pyrinomonadaceae bacterium]|nr:hypothetical protein [Pyrinomonadaceae bacterium]